MNYQRIFCLIMLTFPFFSYGQDWEPLFDPLNDNECDYVFEEEGVKHQEIIQITEQGEWHLYADAEKRGALPKGRVQSKRFHSHYRLRFQYHWGKNNQSGEKWGVGGLFYHLADLKASNTSGFKCHLAFERSGGLELKNAAVTTFLKGGSDLPSLSLLEEGGEMKRIRSADFTRVERKVIPKLERKGWNEIEIEVRGHDWVSYRLNGEEVFYGTRLQWKEKAAGTGMIGFELGGTEMLLRNVEIMPLPSLPESSTQRIVFHGGISEEPSRGTWQLKNTGKTVLALKPKVTGSHKDRFKLVSESSLAPEAISTVKIEFTPEKAGFHSAYLEALGLRVPIAAWMMDQPHEEQEPTFSELLAVLGVPHDFDHREREWKKEVLPVEGSWQGYFKALPGKKARVQALARYSEDQSATISIFRREDGEREAEKIGAFSKAEGNPIKRLQMFPALTEKGTIVEIESEKVFGLYLKPGLKRLYTIKYENIREEVGYDPYLIIPVRELNGKPRENAWIIGFETGGLRDYQDYVFLVDQVKLVK